MAILLGAGMMIQVVGMAGRWGIAVLGPVVLVAALVGAVRHGRHHIAGWGRVWGLLVLSLATMVIAAVFRAKTAGGVVPPMRVSGLSLVADVLALAGLLEMVGLRLPGRAADLFLESVVPASAVGFAVWALAIVPHGAGGWGSGAQLLALVVPLFDFIVLALLLRLLAVTDRCPVAYRYVTAGVAFVLVGDALVAGGALGGGSTIRVTGVTVPHLWGLALWAVAAAHPSQRRPFPAVPRLALKPGRLHMAAMVSYLAIGPMVLAVASATGRPLTLPVVLMGSVLQPALVVVYLTSQVFGRASVEYHAQRDPLTGLANRALFGHQLQSALDVARRSQTKAGIMFLDLDRFKGINDSLGHAAGNDLLRGVSERLEACVRDNDLVARMGGDEFTVLLPDVADAMDCIQVAQRVIDGMATPFSVGGGHLSITTSIGVSVFPDDGEDAETLLKNADTAMYRAKANGRNAVEAFDRGMSARAQVRFALENSLRKAIDSEDLSVYYQPKIDLRTGRTVGVEALARWHHRRLGFIAPWAFIALAEETGLIAPLGEWVLETACGQAKVWHDAGLGPMPVAVNLSPRQFLSGPVVDMVEGVLDRTGLQPHLLELEVTESLFMQDRDAVVASLRALRALGVRCSIDDFGTGYSALSYLADMPIDSLKIDQSFVRGIAPGGGESPLVGAVINLAHSLDLQVVAEGVETEDQLRFLSGAGCEQVQGWVFSPALPAEAVEARLRYQQDGGLETAWKEIEAALSSDRRVAPWAPNPERAATNGDLLAVLHGLCRQEGGAEVDAADVDAVLAALHADIAGGLSAARARSMAMKVGVGTLAGLIPLSGGLATSGSLPGPLRDVAAAVAPEVGATVVPDGTMTTAAGGGEGGAATHGVTAHTVSFQSASAEAEGVDEISGSSADGPVALGATGAGAGAPDVTGASGAGGPDVTPLRGVNAAAGGPSGPGDGPTGFGGGTPGAFGGAAGGGPGVGRPGAGGSGAGGNGGGPNAGGSNQGNPSAGGNAGGSGQGNGGSTGQGTGGTTTGQGTGQGTGQSQGGGQGTGNGNGASTGQGNGGSTGLGNGGSTGQGQGQGTGQGSGGSTGQGTGGSTGQGQGTGQGTGGSTGQGQGTGQGSGGSTGQGQGLGQGSGGSTGQGQGTGQGTGQGNGSGGSTGQGNGQGGGLAIAPGQNQTASDGATGTSPAQTGAVGGGAGNAGNAAGTGGGTSTAPGQTGKR